MGFLYKAKNYSETHVRESKNFLLMLYNPNITFQQFMYQETKHEQAGAVFFAWYVKSC